MQRPASAVSAVGASTADAGPGAATGAGDPAGTATVPTVAGGRADQVQQKSPFTLGLPSRSQGQQAPVTLDAAGSAPGGLSSDTGLPTHYPVSDLQGRTDAELLGILRRVWRCGEKLEVWGRLVERDTPTTIIVKLLEVRSVHDNSLLSYPCDVTYGLNRGVFIDGKYGGELVDAGHKYVRCELVLAPRGERAKHGNPLEVNVRPGSAVPLMEIPALPVTAPAGDRLISAEDATLISQAVYEKVVESRKQELADWEQTVRDGIDAGTEAAKQNLTALLSEYEDLQARLVTAGNDRARLEGEKAHLAEAVIGLQQLQTEEAGKLAALQTAHETARKTMSQHLERLRNYISEKATILKQLGFVDAEEFDMLFADRPDKAEHGERLSFGRDLGGDYARAVSYIQAHLLGQDILYPRHVIENFFTLLRTNDLIILAGDSGSGKTSLVQSFARAVGGVAKIIPVKPNWTSSEDLLGYYNPLEKKYLSTPFLDALVEAGRNPDVPYLICLDEMNLARVEYYFADFLSKLEQRDGVPELQLFSDSESAHVLSELRHVIDIIRTATEKRFATEAPSFVTLLQDPEINAGLRRAFGFSEQDSLVKYHSDIRRMLAGVLNTPSSIPFPSNVRIIGAINIDETTHYLSPKILDRAHVMKFRSPLLADWQEIIGQVAAYGFDDVSRPLALDIADLGSRAPYPKFDQQLPFCQRFVELNRQYFHPLGVEFGLRAIRQGLNYINIFSEFNGDADVAVNNFVLHKVLPKLTFDGRKEASAGVTRLDLLFGLATTLDGLDPDGRLDEGFSVKKALRLIAERAQANDGIVNYWS